MKLFDFFKKMSKWNSIHLSHLKLYSGSHLKTQVLFRYCVAAFSFLKNNKLQLCISKICRLTKVQPQSTTQANNETVYWNTNAS